MTLQDELFEEIEELKKENKEKLDKRDLDLLCFTKLNTRINRDYLDYSLYYSTKGYTKIYGGDLNDTTYLNKMNKKRHYISKGKKISFSDNITSCAYE